MIDRYVVRPHNVIDMFDRHVYLLIAEAGMFTLEQICNAPGVYSAIITHNPGQSIHIEIFAISADPRYTNGIEAIGALQDYLAELSFIDTSIWEESDENGSKG